MNEILKEIKINIETNEIKKYIIYILSLITIIICTQISIPMPNGVPMTLQTFAIAFIGISLDRNKGFKVVTTYLLLGLLGMPVFSGYKFGISTLFGLTGGFLIGFIPMVFCCSIAKEIKKIHYKILLGAVGLMLCHLCGIIQYSFLTKLSIAQSAILVSIPFIVKDLLSIILAILMNDRIEIIKQN